MPLQHFCVKRHSNQYIFNNNNNNKSKTSTGASVVNLVQSQVYHTERPLFAASLLWCSASHGFVGDSWYLFYFWFTSSHIRQIIFLSIHRVIIRHFLHLTAALKHSCFTNLSARGRASPQICCSMPQYPAIMLQHAARSKSQWDIACRPRGQICIWRETWLVITSLNKCYFAVNIRPSLGIRSSMSVHSTCTSSNRVTRVAVVSHFLAYV